jgi:hypothetical protein
MKQKNNLINFCKSFKIVGVPLDTLYKGFCAKYPDMAQKDFECGMLTLNKEPAKALKRECCSYYVNEKEHGYYKFCKERFFVTKEFWDASVKEIAKTKPITQQDPEQPKKDLKKGAQILSDFSFPVIEPVIASEIEIKESVKKETKSDFSKMLPVNWEDMTKSERIEFVQRIKHLKFKEYVMSLDPSLKNFFSKLKAERSVKFKLYVTLFQFPADSHSEESKSLLKCFVNNLNTLGRANLEFVECTNPSVIEIREVR